MFWLVLLIIAGLAGAKLGRSQTVARLLSGGAQKQLAAPSTSLSNFANDNGWKLYAGDDKQVKGEAWKLFTLAGPPSLDVLYALKAMNPVQLAKEPEAYHREPWQLQALLRRSTVDGPQTILGATAPGGTKAVVACLATKATVDHFGLDIVGWDSKVYASGEAPKDVEFDKVLAGFSAPLRMRFAEGTLLLRVPGALTPKLAVTMIERLEMVRNALPLRPDLVGPMR